MGLLDGLKLPTLGEMPRGGWQSTSDMSKPVHFKVITERRTKR